MIKAVFIDFDGTLFSHTMNKIPDSTVLALSKLRENNILVFLCTGRAVTEMTWFDMSSVHFDGQILSNGQVILNEDGKVVADYPIEGKLKERMLKIFNEKKISMYMATEDDIYINFVNEACIKCQSSVNSQIPHVKDYRGEKIYMASAFFEDEDTLNTLLSLNDVADITYWNEGAVDIVPKGVSKSKAIKEAADLYNFDLSETMGIGDGQNDIEMVNECAIGIAMGNGRDSLKQAADYITDDIDEDGLYNALKHFELI